MKFELTILGSNAAVPGNGRNLSAQLLNVHEKYFLIDCGEGTQMQIGKFGIRKSKIHHIFISHLHGDHIFGLIGLLTSFSLDGRKEPIHIYSPKGLERLINVQLEISQSHLTYPLHFYEVDTTVHRLIYESDKIEVFSIPLKHRIEASGYLFKEKPLPLNIRAEKIEAHQIPYTAIPSIKAGEDYITPFGKCIDNKELTLPPKSIRTFAYCSDTMYIESLIPIIEGIDLLYHEATFANEKIEQAKITMHSTAQQAAAIAKMAKVKQLIIGHFSLRYKNVNVLLDEARAVFENTLAAEEGKRYEIPLETFPNPQNENPPSN